jgi:hypothetical protein
MATQTDKELEVKSGTSFRLYFDDRGLYPRIIFRIVNKTLDKAFPLTLDEASILGATMFQAARNAKNKIIHKVGEIVGPM